MSLMLRKVQHVALSGVIGGGLLYTYDELVLCQAVQRSFRAAYCGVAIFVDYKFIWTPYNASEVHSRVARRIVDTCKLNEGLYVKFGQVLGSLEMALPREYISPLSELLDQAKTYSTEVVYDILKEELGEDVLARVTDISSTPVASASVAQVHTAYLDGKQKIALKVQKPNIRIQNDWDMFMYKVILTVLEYSFDIPMVWSYDYVREQLQSELDFTVEAKNATQCRDALAKSRACCDVTYVPETYCSSKRVILSEWIDDTVKITDTNQISNLGLDSQRVVKDATSIFAFQIFGSGSVHCDPHPGNLLVRVAPNQSLDEDSSHIYTKCFNQLCRWLMGSGASMKKQHQIILIDHGLYVHLNTELKKEYVDFWMAIMYGDNAKLRELCSKWGVHDSELFASMTLMRRRNRKLKRQTNTAMAFGSASGENKYENEEGEDRRAGTKKLSDKSDLSPKEKAEKLATYHLKLKERVKFLLKDTSDFPQELGFVNRCVNYIRATNWTHGSPVDRVALFATAAARASAGDNGYIGEWSFASEARVWGLRLHLLLEYWGWATVPTSPSDKKSDNTESPSKTKDIKRIPLWN